MQIADQLHHIACWLNLMQRTMYLSKTILLEIVYNRESYYFSFLYYIF